MTGTAVKWIFLISLVPALAVHLFLTASGVMRRLYCFFNAAMISGNSILYGMILAAPLESDNSFSTLDPEVCLVCIAVMLLLGILYYKTLSVKIRYLISSDSMDLNYKIKCLKSVVKGTDEKNSLKEYDSGILDISFTIKENQVIYDPFDD
jgi:hypothetical protein